MNRFASLLLSTAVTAQQIGTNTQEQHLTLNYSECTKNDGCFESQGQVVLDSNWRWVHNTGGYTNCYTGNEWNQQLCPDNETCTKNCAVDGVDESTWSGTYGVQSNGKNLKLGFVTHGGYGDNVGSRTYLLDHSGHYKQFKLVNKEFSFTVDVSKLPCGINGALYFSQMLPDGGSSEFHNPAAANYGVGYCDAQCPKDLKFIGGQANAEGWKSSGSATGTGKYGSCCPEMDIWEANKISQAFTAHPCNKADPEKCEGAEQCGDNPDHRYDGECDKDGCDFGTYRLGNHTFYGPGSNFDINTEQPFQVITQFLTEHGDEGGDVVEIRRKYVQNGKVIETPSIDVGGKSYDSITDEFCDSAKDLFGDPKDYQKKGGMKKMAQSFAQGMTLVMSIWDDHDARMLWLDSDYPTDKDPSTPGVSRGTCATSSGDPDTVERESPDAYVVYGDIKFGDIGSTYQVSEELLQ